MSEQAPLLRVCSLPNNPGTKYLPIALAEPTGIPALANFLPT